MPNEYLAEQIRFVLELDKLKSIARKSYLADGARRENAAEHSWHAAVMALVLADMGPPDLDRCRVVRMLLLHDIVEIDAGDTDVHDRTAMASKTRREETAAERLFGLLPEDQGRELLELWREFEEGLTPEARFATSVDRVMPLLLSYQNRGKRWREDQIDRQQVSRVFEPLQENAPELWDLSRAIIQQCVDRGYLRDDRDVPRTHNERPG